MKSIIQENSTIVKAISQAWDEAGKPQEFSVKVLQEPETNFFGMTIKSAKVAIFFNDVTHKERTPLKKQRSAQPVEERPVRTTPKHKQEQPVKHESASRYDQQQPARSNRRNNYHENQERTHTERQVTHHGPQEGHAFWTQDMIDAVDVWMNAALAAMEKAGMHFSATADRYLLTIRFDKPLHEDSNKEKDMYRSLSLLAVQSLKHKLKRPLRGFKILLTRA